MERQHVIYEHINLALDLLPGETILNVQRQHWIALGMLFLTHFLFAVLIVSLLIAVYLFEISPIPASFSLYITLLFLSMMAVFGTYTCMSWYFTFYIITNKRLIINQYFKIIGTYYLEMLLHHRLELETKRVAANIIYDLLDIEDVYVTIHTEDIPEPFYFKTPQHPEQIEKALAQIETQITTEEHA